MIGLQPFKKTIEQTIAREQYPKPKAAVAQLKQLQAYESCYSTALKGMFVYAKTFKVLSILSKVHQGNKRAHSNEHVFSAALSCGAVCCAEPGDLTEWELICE